MVSYKFFSVNLTVFFAGVLSAGKKQEVTITFKAEEAKVQVALILLKLQDISNGQELTRSLKVSAIGKYPFITLNTEMIDFEELLIGKVATKEVTITNSSPVPTSFTIQRVNDDGKDTSIHLSHEHAQLLPNTTNTVTITYTPQIQDIITCAYFKVTAAGGNELRFACKGCALGFDVELSAKSMHFGEV